MPTPRFAPHPHPAVDASAKIQRRRHSRQARTRGPAVRTWQDAELVTVEVLRRAGYRDAKPTRAGSDGGIDVAGRRVVAQVKWMNRAVGRPDLQRLVGAAGTSRQLVFVSRSGFSRPALEYARHFSMALITLDEWAVARPANREGRKLLSAWQR